MANLRQVVRGLVVLKLAPPVPSNNSQQFHGHRFDLFDRFAIVLSTDAHRRAVGSAGSIAVGEPVSSTPMPVLATETLHRDAADACPSQSSPPPRLRPPNPVIMVAKAPAAVPESVLKKRRTAEKVAAVQRTAAKKAKTAGKIAKKEYFKRAEKYAAEYRETARHTVEAKRAARKEGKFYVPAAAKVAFVVRIRGINGLAPKVRKVLQLLRLRQIHNGVFIKLNYSTLRMLQRVEPYITYGYPNLKTTRELIYKRGFAKVGSRAKGWSRLPLSDNRVIEANLSKQNIICMEDLIHEIYTVGPSFKQANQFLWPFKLNSPKGGFSKKGKLIHVCEGGEAGNRGELMDRFVRKML